MILKAEVNSLKEAVSSNVVELLGDLEPLDDLCHAEEILEHLEGLKDLKTAEQVKKFIEKDD